MYGEICSVLQCYCFVIKNFGSHFHVQMFHVFLIPILFLNKRTELYRSLLYCLFVMTTQLKRHMFFPVVGSTIRRCTKLYALSHLLWALERTAPTGWHARFGSPASTNLPSTHVGPFLTSVLLSFPSLLLTFTILLDL